MWPLCRTFSEPVQKLTLEISTGEGEANLNTTGMASKFLLDIQRFIACKKLMQQEHLVDAHLGAAFKVVVGHAKVSSGRVSLLFRSNTRLRPDLWTVYV